MQGVTRVGIFGDSFVQNNGMPGPYVFTEPLDYLLNGTGKAFEVLNFGRNGFGADTSYFRYLLQGRHLDLDYVIYVYRQNDIQDICMHPTFDIDADGDFHISPRLPIPICDSFKTCLLTDLWDRGAGHFKTLLSSLFGARKLFAGLTIKFEPRPSENWPLWSGKTCPEYSQPLFEKVVKNWHRKVVENGGRFLVAMVCDNNRDCDNSPVFMGCDVAEKIREDWNIPTVDLVELIQRYQSNTCRSLMFRNDCHWNEEASIPVAVEFFKVLADRFGLVSDDEFIAEKLADYYGSFPEISTGPYFIKEGMRPSSPVKSEIRKKDLALDK